MKGAILACQLFQSRRGPGVVLINILLMLETDVQRSDSPKVTWLKKADPGAEARSLASQHNSLHYSTSHILAAL